MKFQIADAMSVGLISIDADRYDALWTALERGLYGFLSRDMIEIGRRVFPDAPNAPDGSGLDAAYERVCTALDDWFPALSCRSIRRCSCWKPARWGAFLHGAAIVLRSAP